MLKELIRDLLTDAIENGYNVIGWDDKEIAEDMLLFTDIDATVEAVAKCITELRTERGQA